jgi:glutamate dehydrogenase/leucine dehydrogenase
MAALLEKSPAELAAVLRTAGTRRAWLALDPSTGGLRASLPALAPVARAIEQDADAFAGHEAVFLELGGETGALLGAFIHRVERGQAQGGLRHWHYTSLTDYLRDGLRLARGMGRKAALADLWWGGGKGVIAREPAGRADDPGFRRAVYADYGRFVTSLRGAYITAEDAGTTPLDMAVIHEHTRFSTCLPESVGGSGNPSIITATGVVCAIEAALHHVRAGALAGKRIAMQGGGNVGASMIEDLLARDVARVVVAELCTEQRSNLLDRFEGQPVEVRPASPEDQSILAEPCDVLVPNALGGVLNDKTIPSIRARIVCGSANNQLACVRRDGEALARRGIVHVPDYLANRMGIVACGNEHVGHLVRDPMIERHLGRDWDGGIYATTRRLLEAADARGITPCEAADHEADEKIELPNPIWGSRATLIVKSLINEGWERG